MTPPPSRRGKRTALCRHHHRLKTFAPGWHVHQHPDGTLTWTTPTGHTYVSRAGPVARGLPDTPG